MNFTRALMFLFLCAMSFVSLAQADSAGSGDGEAAQEKLLRQVQELVGAGKSGEAIPIIDGMLDSYARKYPEGSTRWYVARTPEETLAYLVQAAAGVDRGEKGDAMSLYVLWSEAHYMKGYALVELGQLADAKAALEQAVHLSPYNARFLTELGQVHQLEKNWEKAYALYLAAADASAFSLPDEKLTDLTRAKRGLGFVLIEQGKLDEARAKLEECLVLNKDDLRAKHELEYIRGLVDAEKSDKAVD